MSSLSLSSLLYNPFPHRAIILSDSPVLMCYLQTAPLGDNDFLPVPWQHWPVHPELWVIIAVSSYPETWLLPVESGSLTRALSDSESVASGTCIIVFSFETKMCLCHRTVALIAKSYTSPLPVIPIYTQQENLLNDTILSQVYQNKYFTLGYNLYLRIRFLKTSVSRSRFDCL